jgi:predicted acetyltransferase
VLEALGTTPVATREVWRYLFNIDLVTKVSTHRLGRDHPLVLMLEDPRQLRTWYRDGIWVRLVDAAAALGARRYGAEGVLTIQLDDEFCPWNDGVWTLTAGPEGSTLHRSGASPDLRLSAGELGALYLGGVSCTGLLRAGRVDELTPGAASRAEGLFRSDVAPWCLDDF